MRVRINSLTKAGIIFSFLLASHAQAFLGVTEGVLYGGCPSAPAALDHFKVPAEPKIEDENGNVLKIESEAENEIASTNPFLIRSLQVPVGENEESISIEMASNFEFSDSSIKHVAVFFHGNSETIYSFRNVFRRLSKENINAVVFDYPCYGNSGGEPSEASLTASGEAVVKELSLEHPERKFVLWGFSLGSAVALQTFAKVKDLGIVDGILLVSPWTTVRSVCVEWSGLLSFYACGSIFLGKNIYDSVAAAADVRVPSLVIASQADQVIPFSQSTEIATLLKSNETTLDRSQLLVLESVPHNRAMMDPQAWKAQLQFLKKFMGIHEEPSPE